MQLNLRGQRLQWLGGFIIALTALVTYLPALKIQFYDGWWYLIWSATMDLPRFLIQFLDPSNITQGYRPVQGIYMYLLFHLFGFDSDGYHLAHTLLHAANSVLVFLIVARLGKRTRLAFVAAVIYAVLPNYSLAVFWHAVVDPLSGFFFLLTILLWSHYLETKRARDYAVTFVAFLLAL
ncbi:MAG: glycosyltransferase family 39 protein, partial [Chloroflexota bacterium]|nr:glycosyltransferase family 39 protein [Chloroflexota bacterium]